MPQQPSPSRTKTESTTAGEQHFIPGAEKVSDAEVAKRKAGEPLKPKVGQKPADEGCLATAQTSSILSTSPERRSRQTLRLAELSRQPEVGDD